MVDNISLDQGIGSIGSLGGGTIKTPSLGESFKDVLVNNIKETNQAMVQSDKMAENFTLGKETDIHKVMMAMERASVAMQYTMQIRNKLMDGFQEIMRIQV